MQTIVKYKWRIAALTLVLMPVCIWLAVILNNETAITFFAIIGMVPLIFAVMAESLNDSMERRRVYKETGTYPEFEGSPVGNVIAKVLLVAVLLMFVLPIAYEIVRELTQ